MTGPADDEVQPIDGVHSRELVSISGRVVALTLSSADAPPHLSVRIDDGSGTIDAVFVGRRTVAGIEPGTRVRLWGRVADSDQGPRIFNPRYELVAE